MRKTPVRHKVRSHSRQGKRIGSFERGKGNKSNKPKKVVGQSKKIPGTDIDFHWRERKEINMIRTWMSPNEFLELVPHVERPEILENRFENESMPSLALWMSKEEKVGGHEGRHRAMLLKELGATSIPVNITYRNSAWNEIGRKLPESINIKNWVPEGQ